MTDLGNGKYEYSYSVSLNGEITILVSKPTTLGVYVEWYGNDIWTGPITYTQYFPTINQDWGLGDVVPGRSDDVSGIYYTQILAPTTDTYTFAVTHDDIVKIYFDGIIRTVTTSNGASTFSVSLEADKYYDLTIEYREEGGGAVLIVKWESSTIALSLIPAANYRYIDYSTSKISQVTVD